MNTLPGVPGAQARALLAPGQTYRGTTTLESMDGVPATNVSAQPHAWKKQTQPEEIITAVVSSTPTELLKKVAPPLAVQQDIIVRFVTFMPNMVMSLRAPGSEGPAIRHTKRKREFVLSRYAISMALNAETANTPEGRRICLAQLGVMAQSGLNTMEMLLIDALMRSEETASSMANMDVRKTAEDAKRDTIDYFRQVGVINKSPTDFINLVEQAKDRIRAFGSQATVAIVPTNLMQRISGTADYNQYNLSGRGRNPGAGVPDYSKLCGLDVIEHSNCGMDSRNNPKRMLRRSILVGEWVPQYSDKLTSIYDYTVGDWREMPPLGTNAGLIIRNFITLVTSSVIIARGGSDFANMAFRLATSMSGMNAGTFGGIQQFAMHVKACIWKPWDCAVINDVMVHAVSRGGGTKYINVNSAGVVDAKFTDRVKVGPVNFAKVVNGTDGKLSGDCLFWRLGDGADGDALVRKVARIFDVTGQKKCGPLGGNAEAGGVAGAYLGDEATGTSLGFVTAMKPKSNGFSFSQCMKNSCVALGSYKLRDAAGSPFEMHVNCGPLSGLEGNCNL